MCFKYLYNFMKMNLIFFKKRKNQERKNSSMMTEDWILFFKYFFESKISKHTFLKIKDFKSNEIMFTFYLSPHIICFSTSRQYEMKVFTVFLHNVLNNIWHKFYFFLIKILNQFSQRNGGVHLWLKYLISLAVHLKLPHQSMKAYIIILK